MKRKLPFMPFSKTDRLFRAFLREWTGLDARRIRREQDEDNYYLIRDLTFSAAQEIWDDGWNAACKFIERTKVTP